MTNFIIKCSGKKSANAGIFYGMKNERFLKEFYFTLYDSKWHNIMQVKNKVENVLKRKPGIFSDRLGKCRDEVKNVKGYILTSQLRTTFEFI